jgi:LacI family transcriptional regulator
MLAKIVPVVVLANREAGRGYDYVGADNRGGSRALTAHLIGVHGFTDLFFLAGPAQSPDSDERFAGFRDALRDAGLRVPDRPAGNGGFTEAGGHQAMRALIARGRRPRALVCGNDEMALGALTALRAARLRVPADVAVTGFDDIAAGRHVMPAVTTVRQPMRDLGERSVRLLLDRIADTDAGHQSVVLPSEMIIRQSCGCASRPMISRRPR